MTTEWKSRRRVVIGKQSHKFSSAHMTVFADGTKERLHGHDYSVQVELQLKDDDAFVEFRQVKTILVAPCSEWDERLLPPARSMFLKIQKQSPELEFTLCGARYVLPADECVMLPVDNVTVESLAAELAARFTLAWRKDATLPDLSSLEVVITETPGQSAGVRLEQER